MTSRLVIQRRIGESICIGDEVRVTLVRRRGNYVVVSVDAPKEMSVDREEIRKRKESKSTIDDKTLP